MFLTAENRDLLNQQQISDFQIVLRSNQHTQSLRTLTADHVNTLVKVSSSPHFYCSLLFSTPLHFNPPHSTALHSTPIPISLLSYPLLSSPLSSPLPYPPLLSVTFYINVVFVCLIISWYVQVGTIKSLHRKLIRSFPPVACTKDAYDCCVVVSHYLYFDLLPLLVGRSQELSLLVPRQEPKPPPSSLNAVNAKQLRLALQSLLSLRSYLE